MKKLYITIFVITYSINFYAQEYKKMISKGTHTVTEIQTAAKTYFANRDKGKGTGYKQYKRWEYNAFRMQDQNGYLKPQSFYFKELERYNAKINNQNKNIQNNDSWEEIGPTNWSNTGGWNPGIGRITSISVDKNNSNHIIIGGQTGGVWRTTDRGTNWSPLSDNHNNMIVYALSIDPSNSNIYYWGSEDGKIYKSINSGTTWSLLATVGNSNIIKIKIHPTNSNIIFVSVNGEDTFSTTNGGTSWNSIGSNNGSYDIEFKPGDSNIVYASGKTFHRSSNGGINWIQISGFSPSNTAKMIAVSANDPNVVYVVESNTSGAFGALYKSTNSGVSFTKIPHNLNYFGYSTIGSDSRGQAPRDMDIAVNPTNVNEIHIAGINTWRSLNGGVSFSPTSSWSLPATQSLGYCHADVDILEFIGNTLYVGTDGGIFLSETTTATISTNYYTDITSGIGIRQFYRFGISQTDPVIISGGSQDNGTSFYNASGQWKDWLGADGMETFIDKTNTNTMYGTIYNGTLLKSINGGNSYFYLASPENKQGNWVTPFEQDLILDNTIYTGYDKVYKSTSNGFTWTAISQDFGTNLDHLKIAPSNSLIMYAAHNHRLYKTTTGSGTWTEITGFQGNINDIAIHPTNPNKIAIATTGSQKVYVSTDGGSIWSSYKKNLPDFSALDLVWQNNANNGLYIGMNYGIYYIDDALITNNTDWESFNNLLPNVKISELEINYAENKLYAATYGRGVWRTPLYNSTLGNNDFIKLDVIKIYPNPAKNNIHISWKESDKTELRLFDIKGRLVHYAKNIILKNTYNLNIKNLDNGVYFLRINTPKGVTIKKIIKK